MRVNCLRPLKFTVGGVTVSPSFSSATTISRSVDGSGNVTDNGAADLKALNTWSTAVSRPAFLRQLISIRMPTICPHRPCRIWYSPSGQNMPPPTGPSTATTVIIRFPLSQALLFLTSPASRTVQPLVTWCSCSAQRTKPARQAYPACLVARPPLPRHRLFGEGWGCLSQPGLVP